MLAGLRRNLVVIGGMEIIQRFASIANVIFELNSGHTGASSPMELGRKALLALFLGVVLALQLLGPVPTSAQGDDNFSFNPFAMDENEAKESCMEALEDAVFAAIDLEDAPDDLKEMLRGAFDEFLEGACDINRFGELEVDIIPADTEGYISVTYHMFAEMGVKFWSPWKDADYCMDPTNIDNSDYEERCYTDLAPDVSGSASGEIRENTTLFTMAGEFWYSKGVGIEDFVSLDLVKIGIRVNNSYIKLEPKRAEYWTFDRWMGECVGNTNEDGVCEIANLYYKTSTWAFFQEVSDVTVEIVDQDGNPISPSFGLGVTIRDIFGHIDSYNLTETTRFEDIPVEGTNVTITMRSPYFESSNGYRFDHVEYEGQVWGWDPDNPLVRIGPHPGENTIRVVFWKRVKVRIETVNDLGVHESASSWTWAPMDSFWVDLRFTPPEGAVSESSRPSSGKYFHGDVITVDVYTTGAATSYSGDHFHRFDHWEGACSGGGSTCLFTIGNADEVSIRAVYWRMAFRVTVYFGWIPKETVYFPYACSRAYLDFSSPPGSYHAPEPDGYYGWAQDAGDVYMQSLVTVTPTDCTEYDLAVDHYEWNWGVTGNNTFVVNRQQNFVKIYYWVLVDLGVNAVDEGGQPLGCGARLDFSAPDGSFHAPEPDGEYANTTIEDIYKKSKVVASPLACPGHLFDHWEAKGMSGDPSTGATVEGDANLTAVYWTAYPMTVEVTDELGNSISCLVQLNFTPPDGARNPPGENGTLGSWFGLQLYRGTYVTFSNVTCSGYRFDHWEVDGARWDSNTTLLMDGPHRIRAVYWKQQKLDLQLKPGHGGRVVPLEGGIHEIDRGDVVTLTAIPYRGFTFTYWLVDGVKVTSQTITVLMDSDHLVEAHFVRSLRTPTMPRYPRIPSATGGPDTRTGASWWL